MTESAAGGVITVHYEIRADRAAVKIVSLADTESFRTILPSADAYRISLGPTSRLQHARACFVDRWGPHRFEEIGALSLIPPGHRLQVRGERGSATSVVCQLDKSLVDNWLIQDSNWDDRQVEAFLDIREPNIRSLVLRLGHETHMTRPDSPHFIACGAAMLGMEIARYCEAAADGPLSGGLAAWRLNLIDERLTDAKSSPSLAELAKICGVSVRQLTRGFRISRGCTIKDHVTNSRIEHAKRLLGAEESVKNVAFAVGFQSVSSFSTAFRRGAGVSPRAFQQRVKRSK